MSKFIRCHLSRWWKELRDDCSVGPVAILHIILGALFIVLGGCVIALVGLIAKSFIVAYGWKTIIVAPLYAIGGLLALAAFWRLGRAFGPPS